MRVWNPDYTEEYSLIDAHDGQGGEGTTHQVVGHPELIAKIYSEDSLARRYPDASGQYTWTMQEKIFYMSSVAKSLNLMTPESGDSVLSAAWPLTPLMDANNRFIGFLMNRVDSLVPELGCVADLHFAYRERERKYLFGDGYTWLTAIALAKNLASVVTNLHKQGIVIGDFNCNNILIDRYAHVTLIDADSFCVRNDLRGITYKCVVGVGEFLAPELQGIDFAEGHSRRTFTKESDCFALAIHIFMLLMNGTHPFSGDKAGTTRRSSSSTEPYVTAIAQGRSPYVTGSRLASFANTPSIHALPVPVRQMFDRAFGYASAGGQITGEVIARRPSAAEWEAILDNLLCECMSSAKHCPVDRTHVNYPGNRTCMWCELDGRLVTLKNIQPTVQDSTYQPRTVDMAAVSGDDVDASERTAKGLLKWLGGVLLVASIVAVIGCFILPNLLNLIPAERQLQDSISDEQIDNTDDTTAARKETEDDNQQNRTPLVSSSNDSSAALKWDRYGDLNVYAVTQLSSVEILSACESAGYVENHSDEGWWYRSNSNGEIEAGIYFSIRALTLTVDNPDYTLASSRYADIPDAYSGLVAESMTATPLCALPWGSDKFGCFAHHGQSQNFMILLSQTNDGIIMVNVIPIAAIQAGVYDDPTLDFGDGTVKSFADVYAELSAQTPQQS